MSQLWPPEGLVENLVAMTMRLHRHCLSLTFLQCPMSLPLRGVELAVLSVADSLRAALLLGGKIVYRGRL